MAGALAFCRQYCRPEAIWWKSPQTWAIWSLKLRRQMGLFRCFLYLCWWRKWYEARFIRGRRPLLPVAGEEPAIWGEEAERCFMAFTKCLHYLIDCTGQSKWGREMSLVYELSMVWKQYGIRLVDGAGFQIWLQGRSRMKNVANPTPPPPISVMSFVNIGCSAPKLIWTENGHIRRAVYPVSHGWSPIWIVSQSPGCWKGVTEVRGLGTTVLDVKSYHFEPDERKRLPWKDGTISHQIHFKYLKDASYLSLLRGIPNLDFFTRWPNLCALFFKTIAKWITESVFKVESTGLW